MVKIKCNSCGVVVDAIPTDRAGSRLMELASIGNVQRPLSVRD